MFRWIFIALLALPSAAHAQDSYDVVIYGGTSGGIAAAVQTVRMGKTALVIEPGKHLGGLTSGGLGATDIGNKAAIGGIAREFYAAVFAYYQNPSAWKQEQRDEYRNKRHLANEDTMWTFEPHVAEEIYRQWLIDAKVPVALGERLDLSQTPERDGTRITSIKMESGRVFRGKMFIDATYEGDLMAKAGVKYHVGREANDVYGETLNGVQLGSRKHQFNRPVDPYVVPGDPASGLVQAIHKGSPGHQGQGDHHVQAYNFRLCMTDDASNRVPFPKPAGYDPARYELLLRYMQAGVFDILGNNQPMPNRKTDTNNNGAFSSDNIGMNYSYPDGDYVIREKIFQDHVTYQQGLMWFVVNDPRVPEVVRQGMSRWGLAADEFLDSGHWPHQMYVREARRMISDYVMTEHNCLGDKLAPDPVGLGAYGMDSHNTQRYVKDGYASNEGDVQVPVSCPYPVAYLSLVPKAKECTNLLVPICLSASHIAYGSIRMEPVFMVLGQSTATAACLAIDSNQSVQAVDRDALHARLLADKQVLEWTGPKRPKRIDATRLAGIVQDDPQAELTGEWTQSRSTGGYVGEQYLHDKHELPGQKQARYTLPIEKAGRYEVRISYTALGNRASNALVTIDAADGPHEVKVDERRPPSIDKLFEPLGKFTFEQGKPAVITFSNAGADGYVVIDAVQLVPDDR